MRYTQAQPPLRSLDCILNVRIRQTLSSGKTHVASPQSRSQPTSGQGHRSTPWGIPLNDLSVPPDEKDLRHHARGGVPPTRPERNGKIIAV